MNQERKLEFRENLQSLRQNVTIVQTENGGEIQSEPRLNQGEIIAVSLCTVVFFMISTVLSCWFYNSRKKRRQRKQEEIEKQQEAEKDATLAGPVPDHLKSLEKRFTKDMTDTIVSYIATLHRDSILKMENEKNFDSDPSIMRSKSVSPEPESSELSTHSTSDQILPISPLSSSAVSPIVSAKASSKSSPKISVKSSPRVPTKEPHQISPNMPEKMSSKATFKSSPEVPKKLHSFDKRPLRFKVSKVEENEKNLTVDDFDATSPADDFRPVQFSKQESLDIQNTQL